MPYIALEHGIPWQKEILAHLDIIFSLSQRYGKLGSYESTPVSYLSNADLMVDCFEMRVHEELTRIWQILYGNLSAVPRIPILNKEATQQIRIQKMLTYIHRNYMHPITLASIASAAAIGKSEAARCFRRYMNDSPISYLLQYRIAQAKQQLQNPHKNVVQICMECGFQSPSYFSKVFRRETGMTPVQYRQYPTP
jgi:AraC-like DNA-binding protein